MSNLVDRLIAQKQFAWQSPLLEEIRAKLERLEQLEKERIDNPLIQQAAHKTSPGISTIPSMQSQAQQHLHIIAAYEQSEIELRERLEQCGADYKRCCELNERMAHEVHDLKAALEKCEAAMRKARTLLISEGDPDEDGEMIAEIDEILGDAARAALEGKCDK